MLSLLAFSPEFYNFIVNFRQSSSHQNLSRRPALLLPATSNSRRSQRECPRPLKSGPSSLNAAHAAPISKGTRSVFVTAEANFGAAEPSTAASFPVGSQAEPAWMSTPPAVSDGPGFKPPERRSGRGRKARRPDPGPSGSGPVLLLHQHLCHLAGGRGRQPSRPQASTGPPFNRAAGRTVWLP